jgi:hypothetical protein
MTNAYRRCDWGRHRVFDDGGMMVSLHGISACEECRDDHDTTCGCEQCRRIGWCPVHGCDLAACEDGRDGRGGTEGGGQNVN